MNVRARPREAWVVSSLVVLWLALVVVGLGWLWRFSETPGRPGTPPAIWPAASRIERAPGRYTLVVALHPHCSCSRATLSELAQLVARNPSQLDTRVLFVRPAGLADPWARSDLWIMAAAIPGARSILDSDAIEAHRFSAYTSGQVALYGPDGALEFSGGITSARGHEGPSLGQDAIIAVMEHRTNTDARAPVFGCSIEAADRSASPHACPAK